MYSPSDDDILILQAAASGDLEHLQGLAGNSPNYGEGFRKRCEIVKDSEGWTALHYGASNGRILICKFLVETVKVDIDIKTEKGVSPLLLALAEGHTSTAKYLIIRGADIALSDSKGITSLHYAAKEVSKELMQLLLLKGSDIEAKSLYGTPLEFAVSCGSDDSVGYLLDHGAKGQLSAFMHREHVSYDNSKLVKRKANEAFKRKDYLDAVKWCSEAINLDPTDAKMLLNRSLCWAHLCEATNALSDAEACVKLRPDWSKAHCTEGVAWKLLKAKAFSKASTLDPGNKEILNAFREATFLQFVDMATKHPLEALKIYDDFNL